MLNRCSVFGVSVFYGDYSAVLDWVLQKPATFRRMVTINPIILESAKQNEDALNWIKTADIVVPDGEGICMAMKRFYGVSQTPIKGIQLVQDILSQGHHTIYILGASLDRLDKAVSFISKRYPEVVVVGSQHGYFNNDELDDIVENIVTLEPDFIFVGMGYPRQEIVIQALSMRLKKGLAIGVGGVIDVLSGEVSWAPLSIRRMRLEWLYRMLKEPRRFRQSPLIFKFLFRTFFGQNV